MKKNVYKIVVFFASVVVASSCFYPNLSLADSWISVSSTTISVTGIVDYPTEQVVFYDVDDQVTPLTTGGNSDYSYAFFGEPTLIPNHEYVACTYSGASHCNIQPEFHFFTAEEGFFVPTSGTTPTPEPTQPLNQATSSIEQVQQNIFHFALLFVLTAFAVPLLLQSRKK